MGRKTIISTLQIIILVLAIICVLINSWQYEFPSIVLPFIFEIEAAAVVFIFLVYNITLCKKTPENVLLLYTLVSLFHGIIFLIISIVMLLTFTGETILGFESDLWDDLDKILLILSGAIGALTSIMLLIKGVICLVGVIKGDEKASFVLEAS